MKSILFLCFYLNLFRCFGQADASRADFDAIYNDLNRLRSKNAKYINTDGSPFFSENWENGSILFRKGNAYENVKLNIDLYTNHVHYLNNGNELMVESELVREVRIYNTNNVNQYHLFRTGINTEKGMSYDFYKVVYEGKLSVLKRLKKKFTEANEFGSKAKFTDEEYLFLSIDNKVTKIKNKDSIFKIFPNEKNQISDFINVNQLKLLEERHLVILANYCNSLILQ